MTQEAPNPQWPDKDAPVSVIRTGKNYVAVFGNDVIMPITSWFDDEGEDCDPDDAIVCVAGSEGLGWVTITLGAGIERVN